MLTGVLPSRELVRQLLDYDPETGAFTWLPRPREMFTSKHNCGTWNTRYAGKKVGCRGRDGYLVVHFGVKAYKLHRFAWLYVHGEPVPVQLDHTDGDRSNNRIGNLRPATSSQNQANKKRNLISVSGVKGVRPYKGSFRAHIRINGEGIHLGTFPTMEDAARAYRDAAVSLFGEFAKWD
jgi:hypothetical protein